MNYLNYDHENVLIFFNEGYQIKADVVPIDVLVGIKGLMIQPCLYAFRPVPIEIGIDKSIN